MHYAAKANIDDEKKNAIRQLHSENLKDLLSLAIRTNIIWAFFLRVCPRQMQSALFQELFLKVYILKNEDTATILPYFSSLLCDACVLYSVHCKFTVSFCRFQCVCLMCIKSRAYSYRIYRPYRCARAFYLCSMFNFPGLYL